jgi:hypothetical protein
MEGNEGGIGLNLLQILLCTPIEKATFAPVLSTGQNHKKHRKKTQWLILI